MNFFKSIRGYFNYLKLKNNKKKKIYFYSEGKHYCNYFSNIIEELSKLDSHNVIYFTSDPHDNTKFANVNSFYIGKGIIRLIFFTTLECDIMVMTLTDLGNHEIKKSNKCKHYLYIFHSLMSVFKGYNKNAFNNYDIIFSNGKYQEDEIRLQEKIYGLKQKKIINTGYPYIENIKKRVKLNVSDGSILFAPSWLNEKNDLIEMYSEEIISKLIEIDKVIFRPHPQSLIKSIKKIKKIQDKYKNNPKFLLNNNIDKIDVLNKSSILITDNGGMAMEYYILYKRPVICIEYKDKIHNMEYKKIKDKALEDNFKDTFTKKIKIDDISNLKDLISNYSKNFSFNEKNLHNFLYENGIIIDNVTERSCKSIIDIIEQN